METDCPNKEAFQKQEACKPLCGDQARYGFCKSSKVGSEEPQVQCEIYEAQNLTHPMQHPAQSKRDCKFHGCPPHHHHPHGPKHAGCDHKDKTPDQRGHPEHAGHDHKDKSPDQRGHPEHAGHDHKDKTPDQRGRPEHAGHDHKDKTPDQRGHQECADHCPKGPSGIPESAPEGRLEFPCHGFVKIPPSVYPICPFPPPRLCRGPPDLVPPSPPPL